MKTIPAPFLLAAAAFGVLIIFFTPYWVMGCLIFAGLGLHLWKNER